MVGTLISNVVIKLTCVNNLVYPCFMLNSRHLRALTLDESQGWDISNVYSDKINM